MNLSWGSRGYSIVGPEYSYDAFTFDAGINNS